MKELSEALETKQRHLKAVSKIESLFSFLRLEKGLHDVDDLIDAFVLVGNRCVDGCGVSVSEQRPLHCSTLSEKHGRHGATTEATIRSLGASSIA